MHVLNYYAREFNQSQSYCCCCWATTMNWTTSWSLTVASCVAYVACVAVGKASVACSSSCPSSWPGGSSQRPHQWWLQVVRWPLLQQTSQLGRGRSLHRGHCTSRHHRYRRLARLLWLLRSRHRRRQRWDRSCASVVQHQAFVHVSMLVQLVLSHHTCCW